MSRVAQIFKQKVTLLVVALFILTAGGGIAVYAKQHTNVQTVTNAQHQLTQFSYKGQSGVNAYTLLKEHAKVGAKHYSFGYFVTSINGSIGNGPKYWTFYINGRQASLGASGYITKNSDRLTWKLQ